MDLSYQMGKGHMLNIMKKHNATVDDTLYILKTYNAKESFIEKINRKIIVFMANQ